MPASTAQPSADDVAIRRIRGGEWAAHRELRLRALSSDPLAFASTFTGESALSEGQWMKRTQRGAATTESALFVADSLRSGWVGMVAIAHVDDVWHVFAMWVDPGHRRQGVGGKLLDAGLEWFRTTAPNQALHLDVNPRQADAVRLYESRGFHRTGASSPLGHTEGETVVSMVLDSR